MSEPMPWVVPMTLLLGGVIVRRVYRSRPPGLARIAVTGLALTLFFSLSVAPSPGDTFQLTCWALVDLAGQAWRSLTMPCPVSTLGGCKLMHRSLAAWLVLLPLPAQWSLWCMLVAMVEWWRGRLFAGRPSVPSGTAAQVAPAVHAQQGASCG